jgi:hypothetical protein
MLVVAGEHTFESLQAVTDACSGQWLDLDPGVLDGAACERLLGLVAVAERRFALVRARLARQAEQANRWHATGHRTPGEWLADDLGTTVGGARAALELADALVAAPATEQALAAGAVSVEQAAEVAAAAKVDPQAEQGLLAAAQRESLSELRRRARKVKAAATDEAARRDKIRKERRFRSWTDVEGAFCFKGRGLPEDGARLLAALKPYQDAAFHDARRAGVREGADAYAYDGFMAMTTGAGPTERAAAARPSRTGAAVEGQGAGAQPRATARGDSARRTVTTGSLDFGPEHARAHDPTKRRCRPLRCQSQRRSGERRRPAAHHRTRRQCRPLRRQRLTRCQAGPRPGMRRCGKRRCRPLRCQSQRRGGWCRRQARQWHPPDRRLARPAGAGLLGTG